MNEENSISRKVVASYYSFSFDWRGVIESLEGW